MLNQSQPQYFSGDSQDSSKGYTSISVREPLRHIRPNTNSNPTGKHHKIFFCHFENFSQHLLFRSLPPKSTK